MRTPRISHWPLPASRGICELTSAFTRSTERRKNVGPNLLGSSGDAEDAVQETFLKLQRSIASFRGQSGFVTWTYRILINTCYVARRSPMRKKEVSGEDTEDSPRPEPYHHRKRASAICL